MSAADPDRRSSGLAQYHPTRRGFVAAGLAAVSAPAVAATVRHGHHTLHTLSAPGAASHGLHAPAVLRAAPAPLPLVMLDPGHGGKDPGAIGVSGTYEKHIAEAAATELQRQLVATGRYRVQMTRSEDRFIPLEGRVEIAQDARAGLFVSMHADALHDPGVRGASVYTLSTGASDAQTAALARRENSADRFAGPAFHGVSPEIQEILASLVSEETRRGSAHMASSVVASFRSRIGLLTNPSRHAAFVVLKSAEIPSVLVEMGFMSNHLDEQALRQSAHRTQVASAMCTAIERYFAQGPGLARMAG
ncbi:N-acetylmuramoyl-L-alanine amidase family protein [Tanticharoenia sakaeratensis]|jgi:N-acetylmuramoyl-L-alanine amidase|uniref:N-acetylmuramoyl-L-alanine amidase n=1 Tax=Tanticharoenia sakaeratensis NBRC 103193 TaxID=1231623 RepID=A0A0D6ML16_9PROT|nr:N-acetylmuramoyl-L-alanine amidase [Tanticharoenia sakaeratensis]GAN54171.1 N-acetylmuramoyl-L-alanine amidase [Tanticharoenia sakaeratensis NBRC 103193]GBQ19385.1 N-acetylmuramoyl-L-alanine amidase [Tanticharoenia sakaeratensis NBRC 103193]